MPTHGGASSRGRRMVARALKDNAWKCVLDGQCIVACAREDDTRSRGNGGNPNRRGEEKEALAHLMGVLICVISVCSGVHLMDMCDIEYKLIF